MRHWIAIAAFSLVATRACADATVTLCATDGQLGAGVNLSNALAAGGIIRFLCPPSTVLRVTKIYRLTAATTIDGAGSLTLDGNGLVGPLLDAGQNSVSLNGLTLRSFVNPRHPGVDTGLLGPAGIVQTSADLTLDSITTDAAPFPFAAAGRMTVRNSNLDTPSGYAVAGADADIENSRFVGGSGLRLSAGNIVNSTFSVMDAAVTVDLPTKPVEIRASSFMSILGNAIQVSTAGRSVAPLTVTIRDNTFSNNAGGAISFANASNTHLGPSHPGAGPAPRQPVLLVTAYNRFTQNQAANGGAVVAELANGATWQSIGDLFVGNIASGDGGAVSVSGGVASITHALFSGNAASGKGAAISVSDNAGAVVANSLAVRNKGRSGVFEGGRLTIVNTTIAANMAVGIAGGAGTRVTNAILAGNEPSDCANQLAGSFVGPNLQSDGTCPGSPTGDAYLDAMFFPAPASPVETAGDTAACAGDPVDGVDLLFQSRGLGGHCALGAFEYVPIRSLQQAAGSPVPHGDPSDDFLDAVAVGPTPPNGGSGGSGTNGSPSTIDQGSSGSGASVVPQPQ